MKPREGRGRMGFIIGFLLHLAFDALIWAGIFGLAEC